MRAITVSRRAQYKTARVRLLSRGSGDQASKRFAYDHPQPRAGAMAR